MLSGTQRRQIRIDQMSIRQVLAGLLLTGIAVIASSQRIVAVPGVEFYLGPLFYLIAYRMGGLPLALGVAVLVMAPTFSWWGHPYSIGIAVCHLLFIHALRHRIPSLLQASALFYLTIGGFLNFAVMWHLHNPPAVVGALLFTRKLLNDLLLAGLVDLLCAFVVIELHPFRLLRRRTISLKLLMLAGTPLSLIGAMAAVFVADVRQFKPTFAAYQESTMLRAEIHWLEGLYAGRVTGALSPCHQAATSRT